MYTIKTDAAKKRVYISFSGFLSYEEAKKSTDETIIATNQFKHGYDVITDISQLKPTLPEVTKEIERTQAHFKNSGVRIGVRIVGQSALTGMQFKRLSGSIGYESVNVASMDEAEKLLDK
ncbi:MAG: hypothetical protein ACYDH2_15940 [Anaerolineaceae bacterium]